LKNLYSGIMGRPDPVKENKTGKLSLFLAHLSS